LIGAVARHIRRRLDDLDCALSGKAREERLGLVGIAKYAGERQLLFGRQAFPRNSWPIPATGPDDNGRDERYLSSIAVGLMPKQELRDAVHLIVVPAVGE
jgi:hypothetical protein